MWKTVVQLLVKKLGKYLGKYLSLSLGKDTVKFTKLASKLGFKSPDKLLEAFIKHPQKIVNKLEHLGTQGRKELAESMGFESTDNLAGHKMPSKGKKESLLEHQPGDMEDRHLSSSWQYWGQFEWTSSTTGTLWLMTKFSPTEYVFPNMPARIWELMKVAQGSHGSGSGSVFWLWYRGYRKTKTAQLMRKTLGSQKSAKISGSKSGVKRLK